MKTDNDTTRSGFPSTWEPLPFSEVVTDATGGNPKVKSSDYKTSGRLPVIDQGRDFISGYVDNEELAARAPLPVVLFGDHTKAFKYVDRPFALGADGVKVLVPRHDVNARFLYHYLLQVRLPDDLGYSRHFKYLKRCQVPLPPLPEQKRIAAILDKADGVRRKRAQTLKLADDFLRSAFLDLFGDPVTNPNGWDLVQLGRLLSFITSGSRGWARYYSEDGARFIRSLDVQMNRIEDTDAVFVKPPKNAECERTRVQVGDVLLTITGSRIGRVAFVPDGFGEAYISQHVALLRPKPTMKPRFLSMLLSLPQGGQRMVEDEQYGQTKPGLNLNQVRGFRVICPPKNAQEAFASIWDNIDQLREKVAEANRLGDRLSSSLVQSAFRGEL